MMRSRSRAAITALLAATALNFAASSAMAKTADAQSARYYEQAAAAYDAKKPRDAVIDLKNALKSDPDNADARRLYGLILLEDGDAIGAERELSRSYELQPDDEVQSMIAEALMLQGNFEKAVRTIQPDAKTDKGLIAKLLVRANALAALNRLDEAKADYTKVLGVDPQRFEARYGLARLAAANGETDDADMMLDKLLTERPDHAAGWMLRGEIALGRKDRYAALDAFDRVVKLQPDNLHAYVARARTHLVAGDVDQARADARKAIDIDPNNPIGRYLSAAIAFSTGDVETANVEYTKVQDIFEEFPPAMLLGALIKFRRNELLQAEQLLNRYVRFVPDSNDARRALAAVKRRNDQPQASVELLNDALRRDPADTEAMSLLASAYMAMDKYDEAAQAYEMLSQRGSPADASTADNALRLLGKRQDVTSPSMRDAIARGYGPALARVADAAAQGESELAVRLLQPVLESAPDNAFVLNIAAGIELSRNDNAAARKMLERAVTQEPEFISALNNLDRISYAEGVEKEIGPRLDALLAKAPTSEILLLRRAKLMLDDGDRAGAVAFLRDRAASMPNSAPLSRALIRSFMLLEQNDEAAKEAARLMAIAPNDVESLTFAAAALRDLGADQAALTAAQALAKVSTDSPQARVVLADTMAATGDKAGAKRTLMEAQAKWPGDRLITRALVEAALNDGDRAAALKAADALKTLDPVATARLRAGALVKLGAPADAVKELEAALAVNPTSEIAVDLFSAKLRAGDREGAFGLATQWLNSYPDDRAVALAYGGSLIAEGRFADADPIYRRLLTQTPNNPIALNNYAWVRHEAGKIDALDYAEKAYRLASQSPEIADTFGWMLVQAGQLKEGVAVLRQAAADGADNGEIQYHYAYALSKAGQAAAAKAVLQKALADSPTFNGRDAAEKLMASLL